MPDSLQALADTVPAFAIIAAILIVRIEWIALTLTHRITRPRES